MDQCRVLTCSEDVFQNFARHKYALKCMFAGATVSVVIDETTDDRAKSAVNILFVNAVANAPKCLWK